MTEKTLASLWELWANDWHEKYTVTVGENKVAVSQYCTLKQNYADVVFSQYSAILNKFKSLYLKENMNVSRYKRAAILAFAVCKAQPLVYFNSQNEEMEPLFLKQQLAFQIALASIIQDFPQEQVIAATRKGKLFDFERLGSLDFENGIALGRDDFLTSIYKDLFFSELYDNFNILTMANVLGLLTERASLLGTIAPTT